MSIFDDVWDEVVLAINPTTFVQPYTWGNAYDQMQGGGGGGPNVGGLTSDQYQEIVNRMNAGQGQGTYGEGLLSSSLIELRQLQDRWRSGELSSSDYANIAGSVFPSLDNAIQTLLGGGSRAADAAKAAGAMELLDIINDGNILQAAQDILGRDITAQDIDKFRPYFEGGDTEGRAYLAEVAEREKYSPEGLLRRAPQHYEDVGNVVTDLLGREATQEELDHYGSLLASGQVDPFMLRSYVRETPEFRTAEDQRFREGLAGELEGYDRDFFNKAQEDVRSRSARGMGGAGTSTSLDFALTELMGDIAKERGRYLSGLSAQQYGGNKEAARQDYLGQMDRYFYDKDYGRRKSDAYQNTLYNRSNELSDYYRMRDDYMSFLNQQSGGGRTPWGEIVGTFAGGAAGAMTGNPLWAMFGANAGRTAGRGYDFAYYNS